MGIAFVLGGLVFRLLFPSRQIRVIYTPAVTDEAGSGSGTIALLVIVLVVMMGIAARYGYL